MDSKGPFVSVFITLLVHDWFDFRTNLLQSGHAYYKEPKVLLNVFFVKLGDNTSIRYVY